MIFALLLIVTTMLLVSALVSAARQTLAAGQAVDEGAPAPLVHVEAPAGFVAPIVVVISDATGRSFRVTIDEYGQQHPEPMMNLN
jgi:hypothetical protein